MARIELAQVSLNFRVRNTGASTLKELFVGSFRRNRRHVEAMTVHALTDVNLAVGEGERLGVIGHNGAGKSTLLKLVAGIYVPTSGRRLVQGRISSLFDLYVGFETESTGYENIYCRGFLQGETPWSLRHRVGEVAEFSELGRFLGMPVRYYSSGMLVKLAFAIATTVDPEVLLIDEVLSAGDLAFQAKAQKRLEELMARAHPMVIASHDLGAIQRLCTRAIWLNQGSIAAAGSVDEVIRAYQTASAA